MTRKNAAWLDATNPTLATMVGTSSDATVTRTVESIISAPVSASTGGPFRVEPKFEEFVARHRRTCDVCSRA